MIRKILLLFFVVCGCSANAGWYRVVNYVGMVGEFPIHLSLQYMEGANEYIFALPGNGKVGDRVKYIGSYYYDRHRYPIALYGNLDHKGVVRLCEVQDQEKLNREVLNNMKKSPVDVSGCQFHLEIKGEKVSGVWGGGKKTYPVSLKKIGALLDVDGEKVKIDGEVAIPFWATTKRHMLVGVYGCAEPGKYCYVRMNKLLAVSRDAGVVDDVIQVPLDGRDAGMSEIVIYRNVENYPPKGEEGVLIHYLDKFDYQTTHVLKTKKK